MTLVMQAAKALQKAGKVPASFAIVHQDDAIKVIHDYTRSLSKRYIDPEYHAKEILVQYPSTEVKPVKQEVVTTVEEKPAQPVVEEVKTEEVKVEEKTATDKKDFKRK